jgi:hypothetical protein
LRHNPNIKVNTSKFLYTVSIKIWGIIISTKTIACVNTLGAYYKYKEIVCKWEVNSICTR